MIKKRKEDGFTLIELMIVIAVIGILAVVLVPKVGTIKTQAKLSGIDTNIRMVQGYVESRISSWKDNSTAAADVKTDIENAFSFATDQMKNPIDGTTADALVVSSTAVADTTDGTYAGVINVDVSNPASIVIRAYDNNKKLIKDKKITIVP